jgi:hypothetical protein
MCKLKILKSEKSLNTHKGQSMVYKTNINTKYCKYDYCVFMIVQKNIQKLIRLYIHDNISMICN